MQKIKRKYSRLVISKLAISIGVGLLEITTPVMAHAQQENHGQENQGIDKATQEALEQTQRLLRDKNQRNAAIQNSPESQSNHQELEKLVGSGKNTDAVYDLSADIFAKLVKESNGDPLIMQQKLLENPQAYLDSLSPEQKARIKAISNSAEANRSPSYKP